MLNSLRRSNPAVSPSIIQIRQRIFFWGGLSALIYLSFVLIFPLVPYIYQDGPMLDLEMILRRTARGLVWIYICGLAILFFASWRIVHLVHQFSREHPESSSALRHWILGIGAVCGLVLLGLYPITALDVAGYVVNARHWVLYDANPLTVPAAAFPEDSYTRLTGEFVKETSPYGPLWEILARLPIQIGIHDIAITILAMKLYSLLAYFGIAALIGWAMRQQSDRFQVRSETALAFFALNPLVLLETIGNGHNDITMMFFMVCGLAFWQRGKWLWAAFLLTLASLIKLPGLILLPLFTLSVLVQAGSWRQRILLGLGIGVVFLATFLAAYCLMGTIPEVFQGALHSFTRRGFSPPYALYVIMREIAPEISRYILAQSRNVYMLIYLFLAIAVVRKRLTLIEAGFLAYFAILFLSNAFRIWYPLWIIPFAALSLNSRMYWRSFLFSLTAELSILSYYILWRWGLRSWEWGQTGPLAPYWDYFKIMTPLTVSWTFTLPFLGDLVGWLHDRERYRNSLWL
jgi:hypothetical protein